MPFSKCCCSTVQCNKSIHSLSSLGNGIKAKIMKIMSSANCKECTVERSFQFNMSPFNYWNKHQYCMRNVHPLITHSTGVSGFLLKQSVGPSVSMFN